MKMPKDQQQLVEMVTREVLAVLAARGMMGGPPAPIQPPVGTCTGDYSKFEELRGRLTGGGDQGHVPPSLPAPAAPPLAGIVTARQLQDAIDASPDGVAAVAPDARLTPLANDLVRQEPQKIRRTAFAAATQTNPLAADDLPWLWWIDGQCPAATQITQQRAAVLQPSGSARHGAALGQVVREVATALRSGRIAGGFLFVPNAARAMCFANRCASIRAVVGSCSKAVEQGVTELGANVLVIEYPHIAPTSMAAMVDRILRQPPKLPAHVQRELNDLHQC